MDYERELEFAKELALEAGQIIRRYFLAEDLNIEIKADNSPVTLADIKINSMVIEKIKRAFPEDGVIGEEESYEPERDRVWICDPIDGTAPFSLGIPASTFLLALVNKSDGQPVVAVVYDPHLDHLYTAVSGSGAYLNGHRLQIQQTGAWDARYVSVYGMKFEEGDISYDPDVFMSELRKKGLRNFALSSGAYTMVKVAQDEFSAMVIGPPAKAWDTAAPALVVQEAGGVVTDLAGRVRRFDEAGAGCIFAANKITHKEILEMVQVR